MKNTLDAKILIKRIIKAREKLGMNKADLARKAGITSSAVSLIEKGQRIPKTAILYKISSALQVSMDYLVGKTNKSKLEDLLQKEDTLRFYRDFHSLNPDDKKHIMSQIEKLKLKRKENL